MLALRPPNRTGLKGVPTKAQDIGEHSAGTGTVMIGGNHSNAYYAAKSGNWNIAACMVKEMQEIREIGETTRSGRADVQVAFE